MGREAINPNRQSRNQSVISEILPDLRRMAQEGSKLKKLTLYCDYVSSGQIEKVIELIPDIKTKEICLAGNIDFFRYQSPLHRFLTPILEKFPPFKGTSEAADHLLVRKLAQTIAANQYIESLSLVGGGFTRMSYQGESSFPFSEFFHLKKLSLSANYCSDEFMDDLMAFLKDPKCQVTEFTLAFGPIYNQEKRGSREKYDALKALLDEYFEIDLLVEHQVFIRKPMVKLQPASITPQHQAKKPLMQEARHKSSSVAITQARAPEAERAKPENTKIMRADERDMSVEPEVPEKGHRKKSPNLAMM